MFHTETLSCKASANWTCNKCFAHAHVSQYLLRFSLLIIYTNKIYLHGARSGFEAESPVHIRTCTWSAGNSIIQKQHSHVPAGTDTCDPNLKGRRPQGTKPVWPAGLPVTSVSSCWTRQHFRICVPDTPLPNLFYQHLPKLRDGAVSTNFSVPTSRSASVDRHIGIYAPDVASCFTTTNTNPLC